MKREEHGRFPLEKKIQVRETSGPEKVSSRWKKERKNEAMNFCVYHCPRI